MAAELRLPATIKIRHATVDADSRSDRGDRQPTGQNTTEANASYGTIPPSRILLSGPSFGTPNQANNFIATISPNSSATPITYTWTATDQPTITRLSGLKDNLEFVWAKSGTYTVSVRAANPYGAIIASRQIMIRTSNPDTAVKQVFLDGATGGVIDERLQFTATVNPIDATLPITYVWQPAGLSMLEQLTGTLSSVTFSWAQAGTFPITVIAMNQNGLATDVFTVEVKMLAPLGIIIDGPELVGVGEPAVFTANLLPSNTSKPLTYTWSANNQTTITHTSGASDSTTFVWQKSGSFSVRVKASNAVGAVSGEKLIEVVDTAKKIFLPLIAR